MSETYSVHVYMYYVWVEVENSSMAIFHRLYIHCIAIIIHVQCTCTCTFVYIHVDTHGLCFRAKIWSAVHVASVPGSLPYACAIFTYDLWTPRNEKSGREPGLFYHVSDVEGREKVEKT